MISEFNSSTFFSEFWKLLFFMFSSFWNVFEHFEHICYVLSGFTCFRHSCMHALLVIAHCRQQFDFAVVVPLGRWPETACKVGFNSFMHITMMQHHACISFERHFMDSWCDLPCLWPNSWEGQEPDDSDMHVGFDLWTGTVKPRALLLFVDGCYVMFMHAWCHACWACSRMSCATCSFWLTCALHCH